MTTELNSCDSKNEACGVSRESWTRPQYTRKEVEGAWEVGVVLPGVKREDVDVQLDADTLTITGKVTRNVPENWKIVHRERSQNDYRLALQLNFEYDAEAISARVENGVLNLRLPLVEKALPKTISVN